MIQLPPEPNEGQPITADWARKVVRCIKALVPKASSTVMPNIGTGGTTYEVRKTATPPPLPKHNFYINLSRNDDDELLAGAADGTINGVTPVLYNGDTAVGAIDTIPAPTVVIADTGTVKAWFKIYEEPIAGNKGTIATPKYRITGGTVTEVRIVFQETAPAGTAASVDVTTGSPTTGIYIRRIGTVQDAAVIRPQPVQYSLSVLLCDDGDSNGILTPGVGL